MKKISVFLAFMLTFLFSACSSSMFDKLVEAYESSTKELASASSNDDCDRIHDELMEKLYKMIASEAIAQNEINLDKIFTKDNLTELPQFPGGKTCIHPIFNGRLMIMDYF